jgi:hypothetical protein
MTRPAAAEIHKTLGHDALPLACRQFPRVCVTDPRGVSVTLSHYCPTAAGLLANESSHASESILTNPARFPPQAEYVGLDAVHALPPLLRPGILMDWDSWWEIERLSVEVLLSPRARCRRSPCAAPRCGRSRVRLVARTGEID